jgi:hypothetical protein
MANDACGSETAYKTGRIVALNLIIPILLLFLVALVLIESDFG